MAATYTLDGEHQSLTDAYRAADSLLKTCAKPNEFMGPFLQILRMDLAAFDSLFPVLPDVREYRIQAVKRPDVRIEDMLSAFALEASAVNDAVSLEYSDFHLVLKAQHRLPGVPTRPSVWMPAIEINFSIADDPYKPTDVHLPRDQMRRVMEKVVRSLAMTYEINAIDAARIVSDLLDANGQHLGGTEVDIGSPDLIAIPMSYHLDLGYNLSCVFLDRRHRLECLMQALIKLGENFSGESNKVVISLLATKTELRKFVGLDLLAEERVSFGEFDILRESAESPRPVWNNPMRRTDELRRNILAEDDLRKALELLGQCSYKHMSISWEWLRWNTPDGAYSEADDENAVEIRAQATSNPVVRIQIGDYVPNKKAIAALIAAKTGLPLSKSKWRRV